MAIIRDFNVDLFHPELFVSDVLQQGTYQDIVLEITVTQHFEEYIIPSTAIVRMDMERHGGTYVSDNTNCKIIDNKVYITVTPEMTEVAGRAAMKLIFINPATGGNIQSIRFHILIQSEIIPDGAFVSSNYFPLLQDALLRVSDATTAIVKAEEATQDAITATQNANTATDTITQTNTDIKAEEAIRVTDENKRISNENARLVYEAYDNAKQYVIGNKVSYNGSSFRCQADCKGVLPTTSSNWLVIAAAGGAISNASQLLITDTGSYYATDNTNAALQQVGATLVDHTTQLASKATQTDFLAEVTNRTNAVTTEKSERLAEIAAERARINTFTTLTSGSTTGDAELIDARIGTDGITYTNAGGAIRGQVNKIKSDLDEHRLLLKSIDDKTTDNVTSEKLNLLTWTNGSINTSGVLVNTTDTGWKHSDFINVTLLRGLSINLHLSTYGAANSVSFYTADKVYISGSSSASTFTITIPSNAVYARFCCSSDSISVSTIYVSMPKKNGFSDRIIADEINLNRSILDIIGNYAFTAISKFKSTTINGITATNNGDGTITVNGTATANTTISFDTITVKANARYWMTGCPSGGTDGTYTLRAGTKLDYGRGVIISMGASDTLISMSIYVANGATISNKIFTPSIVDEAPVSINNRVSILEANINKENTRKWGEVILYNSSLTSQNNDILGGTQIFDSYGLAVGNDILRLNKYYSVANRTVKFVCKFSSDTYCNIGTVINTGASTYGFNTNCWIDLRYSQAYMYPYNSQDISSRCPILNNTDEFIITISKYYQRQTFGILNLATGKKWEQTVIVNGAGGYGAGAVSESNDGRMPWDYYGFQLLSGSSFSISRITVTCAKAYLIAYGDSITEGECYWSTELFPNHWMQLLAKATNDRALSSGRSATGIVQLLERIKNEIPYIKPKYVMVTIGTNGGNSVANLTELVTYIKSQGAIPILNHVPCFNNNGNTTAFTVMNEIIDTVRNNENVIGCDFDIATSVNRDGVTVDTSAMWYEDYSSTNGTYFYHHPNVKGCAQMFTQLQIDVPDIFTA